MMGRFQIWMSRRALIGGAAALIACYVSVGEAAEAQQVIEPTHLAQKHLAIAYAQAELRWVLTGQYPQSVDSVVEGGPRSAFRKPDPGVILDPWSAYGFPLRYRVVNAAVQIASIGPDRRWGGWKQENAFFSGDDLIGSARTMPGLVDEYMHSVYCIERERQRLAYPRPRVEVPNEIHVTRAAVREMGLRKARAPLESLDMNTVESYLEQEWNVKLSFRPFGVAEAFTGLVLPLPEKLQGRCPTLAEVTGALGEASPFWVAAVVISEDSWALEQPEESAYSSAFGDILSLEQYAAPMDDLATLLSFCEDDLGNVILVFREVRLDAGQLVRLEEALHRIFGEDRIEIRVLEGDLALRGLGSLSQLFFAIDALGAEAPSIEEYLELRGTVGARKSHDGS